MKWTINDKKDINYDNLKIKISCIQKVSMHPLKKNSFGVGPF